MLNLSPQSRRRDRKLRAPMHPAAFAADLRASRFGPVRLACALCLLALGAACVSPSQSFDALTRVQPETSLVRAADGALLATLHAEEDRLQVPLSEIPKSLRDAVVAVEDRRFWTHSGIDLRAVLRAAKRDVVEGKIVEGGSTITQQYVKNLFLGRERTLQRKIREATMAYELERHETKEHILELYLNTVYFGEGAYGAQAAAQAYFGKDVAMLDVARAALLAGLVRAPAAYNPFTAPESALARRSVVLDQMLREGYLTADAVAAAKAQPLGLAPRQADEPFTAPYFVRYMQDLILDPAHQEFDALGTTREERQNLLFKGGLRIQTTLDPKVQAYAEEAAAKVLSNPDRDPYPGIAILDTADGAVRAMVGGRDFYGDTRFGKVNLALGGATGRQSGSAFKVFALVAALEAGISPERTYPGGPTITIPMPGGKSWEVTNYEGVAFRRLNLREATIHSVNVAYARLLLDLGHGSATAGASAVNAVARRMGIRSRLVDVPAAVLGANEVNPLEMAAAFACLANGGIRVEPYPIAKITDSAGKVLYEAKREPARVLSPAVAALTTDILSDVVTRGTGTMANIHRPAAGKTGTTSGYHDAWFVGFTPAMSAAVWVGRPEGQISMVPANGFKLRVAGGTLPALIWQWLMGNAMKDRPSDPFPVGADDLVRVRVDLGRGCLPNPYTPAEEIGEQLFVKGSEPKERCTEPAGPVLAQVPDVLGMPRERATEILEGQGLTVAFLSQFSSTYPPGTVLAQDPPSGTKLPPGAQVRLTVASSQQPTMAVPDVLGLGRSEAQAAIQQAGLTGRVMTESESSDCATLQANAGKVWSQSPPAGTQVKPGTTVTIKVDPDPAPCAPQ